MPSFIVLGTALAFAISLWAEVAARTTLRRLAGARPRNGLSGEEIARFLLRRGGQAQGRVARVEPDRWSPAPACPAARGEGVVLASDLAGARDLRAFGLAALAAGQALQGPRRRLLRRGLVWLGRIQSALLWPGLAVLILVADAEWTEGVAGLCVAGFLLQVIGLVAAELDAARRGLAQLAGSGLVESAGEDRGIKRALLAAALLPLGSSLTGAWRALFA